MSKMIDELPAPPPGLEWALLRVINNDNQLDLRLRNIQGKSMWGHGLIDITGSQGQVLHPTLVKNYIQNTSRLILNRYEAMQAEQRRKRELERAKHALINQILGEFS